MRNLELIKKLPIFEHITLESLHTLLNSFSEERTYLENEVISKGGQVSSDFYVIKSGRVRLTYPKGNTLIKELSKGECFGLTSLIKYLPWSLTATATETCSVLLFSGTSFHEFALKNVRIYISISDYLFQCLKECYKQNKNSSETSQPLNVKRTQDIEGTLEKYSALTLLDLAKKNFFSGNILFRKEEEEGIMVFEGGELKKTSLAGHENKEYLKELINWKKGSFSIHSKPFSFDFPDDFLQKKKTLEAEDKKSAHIKIKKEESSSAKKEKLAISSKVEFQSDKTITLDLFLETINNLVLLTLEKIQKSIVDALLHEALWILEKNTPGGDFFLITPEGKISYKKKQRTDKILNKKDAFFIAKWFRLFIQECSYLENKFDSFDLRKHTKEYSKMLEKTGFYEVYEKAID